MLGAGYPAIAQATQQFTGRRVESQEPVAGLFSTNGENINYASVQDGEAFLSTAAQIYQPGTHNLPVNFTGIKTDSKCTGCGPLECANVPTGTLFGTQN